MKQTTLAKLLALGVACGMGISVAWAQQTTTTTSTDAATGTTTASTTTSTGTIVNTVPSSDYITFRTSTSAEPTRYYYTKNTTILDPEGRTVAWSDVRPDMPATVYYTHEGDRVVVSKVVLSQPVIVHKETTTTTTTVHKH